MNTKTIYAQHTETIDGVRIVYQRKNVKRMAIHMESADLVRVVYTMRHTTDDARAFVAKNMEWIRTRGASMKSSEDLRKDRRPYGDVERDEFMRRLKDLFPKCEERMGLYATHVAISLMKTRWGSCAPRTRRISINVALARLPEECLEYVIIHELAHITHPDHSEQFWALVEKYCPEHRRIRALLKQHNPLTV